MARERDITERGDDGGSRPMTPEELKELKGEITQIRSFATQVIARRLINEETRFCRWQGQAPDGRKHAEFMGDDVLPFEGAMDARVRTSDKIIIRHAAQLTQATLRATPKVSGVESNKSGMAGKIKTLLAWIIHNQWGAEFRRQVALLAQYQETDAYAICMVDWTREQALELREITVDVLAQLILENLDYGTGQPAAGGPDDAQGPVAGGQPPVPGDPNQAEITEQVVMQVNELVSNPLLAGELKALLAQIFPGVTPSRIGKIVKEIYEKGKSSVPMPYVKINLPEIAALRCYQDVFFPENSSDLQRTRRLFRREWLTKPEVLERAATQGWDKDFVKDLLENEGKSGFEEWDQLRLTRSTLYNNVQLRRGLHEVITDFAHCTNEDGISGIYVTVFSAYSEHTAGDSVLWDRKHGKYPFVWFSREECTDLLLDARSIPELAQTDQNEEKMYHDSFADHVTVSIHPPLICPPGSPKYELALTPFGRIDASPRGEPHYLKRPDYPQAAEKMWEASRLATADYFGIPMTGVDPSVVTLMAQERVDRFLASIADVMKMVLQLAQQYMSDEMIQRVVGGNGLPIARSRDEIQGAFDVTLCFDVRDLDPDYVMQKAKTMRELLMPMDAQATVKWGVGAQKLLAQIDPNWADEMVIPDEQATEQEVYAAKAAFVSIINGVRPQMQQGGINAATRLQVIQGEIQQRQANPAAFAPLTPASQMLLQEYLQYLQFQQQQYQENPATGRLGVDTKKTDQRIAEGGGQPAPMAAGAGMNMPGALPMKQGGSQ